MDWSKIMDKRKSFLPILCPFLIIKILNNDVFKRNFRFRLKYDQVKCL